jgi:RND family efflux transporter MFP subunit
VHDNQRVHKGDVLFRIDPDRFDLALRQAEAIVAGKQASLEQAESDYQRYDKLSDNAVSQQRLELAKAVADEAKAVHDQAVADRDLARLNRVRSEVRASVNGLITNMDLQPGAYVSVGHGVTALIDEDTLHVEGYFEETKLPRIHIGDAATVHLVGERTLLTGHVESIAGGIDDRERSSGSNLLANVNPTFSWVRLAQRIPVRIALDPLPKGVLLVAGRTATVEVKPGPAGPAM